LAAGVGTRLLCSGGAKHKCLIKIQGTSILERQINILKRCGIKDIVIVVGHAANAVKACAAKYRDLNVAFVYNPKFYNTNTFYSLALATKYVKRGETVIQINGDLIFDYRILKQMLSNKRSLMATEYKRCGAEEIKVKINKYGSISKINKSVLPAESVGEALGLNKFSPKFWHAVAANLKNFQEKFSSEYFERAVEKTLKKESIWPHNIAPFGAIEIDFPRDLKNAKRLLKEKPILI